jgi:FKBP-type peptidyl-prolyl cis-trans isomerase FkpA
VEQIRRSTLPTIALMLSALITGCGETPTTPSQYAPFSQTDLRVGTGTEATTSNRVTVDYTLWLYDVTATGNRGIQIESSVGGTPFTFVLGSSDVIQGWNRGIAGMRVGGIRRLVIPPSLAYGQDRKGIIPQNATLVFDIELLDVTTS